MTADGKLQIWVEQWSKEKNKWLWWGYLIPHAEGPGHNHSTAGQGWVWARHVVAKFPEEFRIVRET